MLLMIWAVSQVELWNSLLRRCWRSAFVTSLIAQRIRGARSSIVVRVFRVFNGVV